MLKKIIQHKNIFFFLITTSTLVLFLAIWVISKKTELVQISNMQIFSLWLRIAFVLGMILIGIAEFYKTNNDLRLLFSLRNLLIISLIISLIFSISDYKLSSYSIGIYVIFALTYFIQKGELYRLNKIYYLLFAYALLQFIGTIGTSRGFHFPEKTFSYYILPLSYCFFQFSKQTMLRILKLVFRIVFLYSCITLIYWWLNTFSMNVHPFTWLTTKINFADFAAWYYVGQWANFVINGVFVNYSHPTLVSLVLICGLIAGFYLHYKKNDKSYLSTLELIAYSISSFILIMAFESRIGAIGFIVISAISLLYYIKLKTPYFKHILFSVFAIGIILFSVVGNKVTNGLSDKPREISFAFAIHHIKDNPWWGSGTEEQKSALNKADEAMPEVSRIHGFPQYLYSHNQFLGDTVQFGIWGFIMLTILITGFIFYAFKSRNYMLQMFWLIYLLCMMIEEPIYIQQGILRFCVFLTFFLAIGDTERTAIPLKYLKKATDKYQNKE